MFMKPSPNFHTGGFSLCFSSVFIFAVLPSSFRGRDEGAGDLPYSLAIRAVKQLYTPVLLLLMSGGSMRLRYSCGSLSNGEDNLDSFRESVVFIPPLLLSVLISQLYLPFSRIKFLNGVIRHVQYIVLFLNVFRRCQD